MAPTGFLARMKALYTGEKEPEIPAMKTSLAVALLVLYTLVYVLPFYFSSTTRPSPTLSRDAPSVIRGRIRLVTTSCIVCSISTFLILSGIKNGSPLEAVHQMGYWPVGLYGALQTLGLTAVLFLGPLFEAAFAKGQWRNWIRLRGSYTFLSSWMGYRNMVAGPVTEEILFRSCSVPLLLLSQTTNTRIIFLTPIIFGLAHVHHFYEFRITHPHTPLVAAIARTVLQFTYTTLFGGYVTFLYMRTGSLLGAILVHSFCNFMGFPRFWGRVEAGETVMGPDVGEGKRSEDGQKEGEGEGELHVGWTVVYYVLLTVGAVSWYKLLWPWTESELTLTKF